MKPEELIELFLKFENDHKMFKLKMKNVYIWHYIRFNVFYEISNIYGTAKALTEITIKKRAGNLKWENFLKKVFSCNQFLAQPRDVLIIPHERKFYDTKGYYKCIYTRIKRKFNRNSGSLPLLF